MKNYKAFTMAETLTVLIIMGVIISITMPSIIRKHSAAVKRIKIKKALTIYDVAIHSMFDEHGFTTKEAFLAWANSATAHDCANTNPYFKKSEFMKLHNSNEKSGCIFKTTDNIWWDITKIDNPIIIFNEKYLNCLNGSTNECSQSYLESRAKMGTDKDTDVFAMSFQIDEQTGMIHVNDKVYEEEINNNDDNTNYMAKIFNFINDKKYTSDVSVPDINNIKLNEDVNVNVSHGGYYCPPYPDYICDYMDNHDNIKRCKSSNKNDLYDCQWCKNNTICDVYDENGIRIAKKDKCSNNYSFCATEVLFRADDPDGKGAGSVPLSVKTGCNQDGTCEYKKNFCISEPYKSCEYCHQSVCDVYNESNRVIKRSGYTDGSSAYIHTFKNYTTQETYRPDGTKETRLTGCNVGNNTCTTKEGYGTNGSIIKYKMSDCDLEGNCTTCVSGSCPDNLPSTNI